MATFKVGDRVRVIALRPVTFRTRVRVGMQGRIVQAGPVETWGGHMAEWAVDLDDVWQELFGLDSWELAPLTDPKADEFIERIKKLKPYDEPTVRPRVPSHG